ncbi:hypothetical protein HUG10_16540 [Halorarum halophilum]|uniref:DUF7282 domain-containing protein n=1 Tax=Halorarum halophilum TaxID=2743090 RepID=A0A7D5GMV3_9EURY|nr:hypothetical protein [Halobaculum halophilum]QLG29047.1 hypothetical protein HUG10_16540 [Halobaculum halophilum]
MTTRNAVVSLVAALVVVSVLAPAAAWSAGAQGQQQQERQGLVVESLDAPGAATPNSTITVNATISNPTSQELTEEVAFRLVGDDQDIVERQSVTVGPDGTTSVSFTLETTNFGTGDYIHGVTTANSSQFAQLDVTTDADVSFDEQESDGTQVTVDEVFVPEGGYVTIHDQRLLEGDALGSVIGVSSYLEPGFHEDVDVTLFDVPGAQFQTSELTESQVLFAMPHLETNNDRTYDFVSSNGSADGPYTVEGEAVTSPAPVTVANGTAGGGADGGTSTPDAGTDEPTGTATETEFGGADDGETTGTEIVDAGGDENETTGTETGSPSLVAELGSGN